MALLDVGTKPDPTGLLNLLKGFNDCNVGGVTGLMSIDSDFRSEEGGDKEEEEEGFFKRNFASI